MTLALFCVAESIALFVYVARETRESCLCPPGGRSCVCPHHGDHQR